MLLIATISVPSNNIYNHESVKFMHCSFTTNFFYNRFHIETHHVPLPLVTNLNLVSQYSPYWPKYLFDLLITENTFFFIQFVLKYTIWLRWLLVRIELDLAYLLNLHPEKTRYYLVTFLAHHPSDKFKFSELSI